MEKLSQGNKVEGQEEVAHGGLLPLVWANTETFGAKSDVGSRHVSEHAVNKTGIIATKLYDA